MSMSFRLLCAVLLVCQLAWGFNPLSARAGTRLMSPNAFQKSKRHDLAMRSYGLSAGYLAKKGVGSNGVSSEKSSTINLTKNMVGAGVFSMSAKVALLSGSTSIMGPVSAMVGVMAAWAAYNFYTLSEVCRITNSPTYPEAWARTVGPSTKFIVSFVIVMAPIIACLSNTIVLTEALGTLLSVFGAPASIAGNRNAVIALLSSVVFYPLCVKQNLGNLKNASLFGIFGHLTALGVMAKRAFDGSYAAGGAYYAGSAMEAAALAAAKTKGKAVAAAAPSLSAYFVVASMVSYCIVSHYNTAKYYNELQKKDRMFPVAIKAHMATAAIYISSMFVGLKLFGKHSKSFALSSLSASDPLAILANAAFGCSVLASQPLIFLVMRNTFVDGLQKLLPGMKKAFSVQSVTIALLALIGGICSKVQDVATIGTVAGSLLGSAMMFVFPPLLHNIALKKEARANDTKAPALKMAFNSVLLLAGLGFWSYASKSAMTNFIASLA